MELTEIQKKDSERFRVKQEFPDGNKKGSMIIDEVSLELFLEFRDISRKYAGNKDGATFTCLVQMFLAEKNKQAAIKELESKDLNIN